MKKFYHGIWCFLKDEEGVTSIEYALIAVLIAVMIVTAAATIGTHLTCSFNQIADCFTHPGTCASACP